MTTLSSERTETKLITFIRERFLAGDAGGELSADTPLLEWGVLDSLKVAILLNFIRDELGTTIPFEKISARHFKDVRSIAALVDETPADA